MSDASRPVSREVTLLNRRGLHEGGTVGAVAGMPWDGRGERLAGTVAETRAELQAGDAAFASQLRGAIARLGGAADVAAV